MVKRYYDDDHWYWGYGWKDLRRSVVRLALELYGGSVETATVDGAPEIVAQKLVDRLIQVIEARRRAALRDRFGSDDVSPGEGPTKWDYALSLFGDVAPLVKAISEDRTLISNSGGHDEGARKALVTLLKRFLERERRGLAPTTPHRQRVWEKIDSISRRIGAGEWSGQRRDRCVEEHFKAVHSQLAEQFGGDKNFSISLDQVRAYFYKFCPDCRNTYVDDLADIEQNGPSDIHFGELSSSFAQAAFEDFGRTIAPDFCLGKLEESEPDLWEAVMVETQWKDRIVMTQTVYRAEKGLTRYTYEKNLKRGLEILADCVSGLIEFQARRWQ